jgi:hypothetical protein
MKGLQGIILKFKRIRIVISSSRKNVYNFPDDKGVWNERIAALENYHEGVRRLEELRYEAFCYYS